MTRPVDSGGSVPSSYSRAQQYLNTSTATNDPALVSNADALLKNRSKTTEPVAGSGTRKPILSDQDYKDLQTWSDVLRPGAKDSSGNLYSDASKAFARAKLQAATESSVNKISAATSGDDRVSRRTKSDLPDFKFQQVDGFDPTAVIKNGTKVNISAVPTLPPVNATSTGQIISGYQGPYVPGEPYASVSATKALFTGPNGTAESKEFDAEMTQAITDYNNAPPGTVLNAQAAARISDLNNQIPALKAAVDWSNASTDADKTAAATELKGVSTTGLNDNLTSEITTDQGAASTYTASAKTLNDALNPADHQVTSKDADGRWGVATRQLQASAVAIDPSKKDWVPSPQQVEAYVNAINKANPSSNPSLIYVGDTLKLPPIGADQLPAGITTTPAATT